MSLLAAFHTTLNTGWQTVFPQERTRQRAIEHALAVPCVLGRRTISRTVGALGRGEQDWSADYKLFSRSAWEAGRLFAPAIDEYLERYPQGPVVAAIDDTRLPKTGKKIKGTGWGRDPLSPPFHVNLTYGQRFIQASLLYRHYEEGAYPPRGFPVRFDLATPLKKPGKRASAAAREEYRRLKKETNLSRQSLGVMGELRTIVDERDGDERDLLFVGDGNYCNRTVYKANLERINLVTRCRKDARLCFPAAPGSRRKYAAELFTPEQVLKQEDRPWRKARVYLGGKPRFVKYKEVSGVLWRRGAGLRKLRLLVIAPVPYYLSKNSPRNFRQPAYFLSTDLDSPAKFLIQACFDRWQIEVNHRDEKDLLKVGQAQVWSEQSIPRHPAFAVASYSLLMLAALKRFGPGRTDDFLPQPKWRKPKQRPSLLDMVSLLRHECNETLVSDFLPDGFNKNLLVWADT